MWEGWIHWGKDAVIGWGFCVVDVVMMDMFKEGDMRVEMEDKVDASPSSFK